MFDCVRLSMRRGPPCQAGRTRVATDIGGTPWPRLAPDRGQQLFVRQSTGLVREASALDATIFNAVFSAPVGATLAWGVFAALSAVPRRRHRRRDDHLGDHQHPGPDHDGAARLEHAPDRRRLRLGQPDPVAAAGPRLELRRGAVGDDRRDVLGPLLPGLRARARSWSRSASSSTTRRSSSGATTSRRTASGSSPGRW